MYKCTVYSVLIMYCNCNYVENSLKKVFKNYYKSDLVGQELKRELPIKHPENSEIGSVLVNDFWTLPPQAQLPLLSISYMTKLVN